MVRGDIIDPLSMRVAVVTGANKGIGFEICKQLASNGISVVLTARDEKRGNEAVEKLEAEGLTDVTFHQLDLMDPDSIASLAEFVKTYFGKLDILVNNAGINGMDVNPEDRKNLKYDFDDIVGKGAAAQKKVFKQTYELARDCLKTNYYGVKHLTESALLPLLEQSSSPRIVNVSSPLGKLQFIPHEGAKKDLGDVDSLTQEKIDKVVEQYLKDFKELDEPGSRGWPILYSAYIVSKAALNAYTRLLAKKYPNIKTNAVYPGFVRTDINYTHGFFSVEEGARGPVMLALMDNDGPSGLVFDQTEISEF